MGKITPPRAARGGVILQKSYLSLIINCLDHLSPILNTDRNQHNSTIHFMKGKHK